MPKPKESIREWWTKKAKSYGSYHEAVQGCIDQLGVTQHAIGKKVPKIHSGFNGKNEKPFPMSRPAQMSKMTGLSELELRSKYDALYKLETAVNSLSRGNFIAEQEFRAGINLEPSKFRSKADLPQFEQYKGKVAGITYWGHPADIKKLKNEGVLQ